jgi:hypothetical protein
VDGWTLYEEKMFEVFFPSVYLLGIFRGRIYFYKIYPGANLLPTSKNAGALTKRLTYRLVIQSVMLAFLSQLCELFPSNLLSGSTLPPPFQTVCAWLGGDGVC